MKNSNPVCKDNRIYNRSLMQTEKSHRRPIFDNFITYDIKISYILSVISFIFFTFYVALPIHSVFFVVVQNDVTSEIKSSDVTFNVACELSQPMGKTNFPAPLKIEQILSRR